MKVGYVYLMASKRNGTLYLGVTSSLAQRAWQHRNKLMNGFSKDYGCTKLVWFEMFEDLQEGRACELRMKKWKRVWKIELIEKMNPGWEDLFESIAH